MKTNLLYFRVVAKSVLLMLSEWSEMKLSRVEVLIVVSALLLAGCATAKKAEAALPSDGKVEGTLTINRNTFPLKYVYVGREPRPSDREPPGIEVLVTNEALSYEILSSEA